MSRIKDREIALKLRKEGKSYSQIKAALGVPKSTLSGWLNHLPLTKRQIHLIRDINSKRIEKFRATMRRKRDDHVKVIFEKQKNKMLPLTQRELFLCGLFLYLGEGTKVERSKLSITNSDPDIIKFTLYWFTKILKIQRNKIRINLQLYHDMDIARELNFWKNHLNLDSEHFNKPYIKDSSKQRINHKGSFSHGTCAISFYSVNMKDEIITSIGVILDKYK
mgnify:CR=1 FL=1